MTPPEESEPASFPRRLLLAVVGLTPQVVTEALYALAVLRRPPFVPTEIHIATTGEGRERVILTLLEPESGALAAFARDYPDALPSQALTQDRIHVIHGPDGRELVDIGTAKENTIAADYLCRLVRGLTMDDRAAVHVSIAGGRKTMGFFAGYALSLFGRAQDRLSHVLVSEAFESHPQFFYPPPRPRVLMTRHNRPVRTDAASIALADIPFVRLRHGLPRALLDGELSYGEAVGAAQQRFAPPTLVLQLRPRRVIAGGTEMSLPPVIFAWLVWLAGRCRDLGPDGGAVHWRDPAARSFLDVFTTVCSDDNRFLERVSRALARGMTKEYFEEKKCRYNKLVKDALGGCADAYLIKAFGSRPQTRFGLSLPPTAIRIVDGGGDAEEAAGR